MRERLLRFRPDSLKFDRLLAAILTVALLLETWLGGNAEGHRIALSIGGVATTVAVAFRRRYPAVVGIGSALSSVVLQAFWPSAEVTYGIAWICNMYAFAVWTRTRVFAIGLAVYVGSALTLAVLPLGPYGGGEHGLKHSVPFIVISSLVMLVVRRVVGDRDRRARMAERERDLVAREAVLEERARIARELHDVIAAQRLDDGRPGGRGAAAGSRRGAGLDARGARDGRADWPRSAHRDAPARRDAPYRRAGRALSAARS